MHLQLRGHTSFRFYHICILNKTTVGNKSRTLKTKNKNSFFDIYFLFLEILMIFFSFGEYILKENLIMKKIKIDNELSSNFYFLFLKFTFQINDFICSVKKIVWLL